MPAHPFGAPRAAPPAPPATTHTPPARAAVLADDVTVAQAVETAWHRIVDIDPATPDAILAAACHLILAHGTDNRRRTAQRLLDQHAGRPS